MKPRKCSSTAKRRTVGRATAAAVLIASAIWSCVGEGVDTRGEAERPETASYGGSTSCRSCHEPFYELWASSRHGQAMRPFTPEFAETQVISQEDEIQIGDKLYRAVIEGGTGWVLERGSDGEKKYPMEYVLGGKNVYFFLTPLDRGRLQVLPVAFDVRRKVWYNTTASMVRHIEGLDEPLDWKDWPLTFNTACYSCHTSQLSTNYDLETDTYHTVWVEPGINCEACHGPGAEHNRLCEEDPAACEGAALKIISTKSFTPEQTNDLCAPCHAKGSLLKPISTPGDRFFDYHDLAALEDVDFYPDGRDLGENYTYTHWLMSPCVRSSSIDCLHCHTSSGGYLYLGENANDACVPCHAERVQNATAHTHHEQTSPGNRCISCHMPTTEFARMRRTDHSMRAPTPAATIQFGSPNACNLCHTDRDAVWADERVREWRSRDYQAAVLYSAGLIEAARRREWTRLPDMLAYLGRDDRDPVFTASLIRLLAAAEDARKWPAIRAALSDQSPLVRSAAASALAYHVDPETVEALLEATGDDYRLVRVRAASALASYSPAAFDPEDRERLGRATAELQESLLSRPDDGFSHYNLGSYLVSRGDIRAALAEFELAIGLRPRFVPAYVNAAIAYAKLGRPDAAEDLLRKALAIDPESAEANFNLGILVAERGSLREAETFLRRALEFDPSFAAAAYNLCVVVSTVRIEEAISWCERAVELSPGDPAYLNALAYYRLERGDTSSAAQMLASLITVHPTGADAYLLLGQIYENQERFSEAAALYAQALRIEAIEGRARDALSARLLAVQER